MLYIIYNFCRNAEYFNKNPKLTTLNKNDPALATITQNSINTE